MKNQDDHLKQEHACALIPKRISRSRNKIELKQFQEYDSSKFTEDQLDSYFKFCKNIFPTNEK